ncbi:MAG: ATP-binding protein [Succinivibrio sp.]|nr:ATP-binding protein [Succinivibrio sp.]
MIGRTDEIKRLKTLYESNKAEFVAVYGRRRVGKTFLVDETFKDKFTFRHAGLSPLELEEKDSATPLRNQLRHFYDSMLLHGMKKSRCPDNWLDAFLMLEMFLQQQDQNVRQVVFFDELPWMDTQKSGFLTAFEGFWNNWGCHRSNLLLIVCGSATTWIKNRLIENHGGLYGRLTCEIKLAPFSLRECASFVQTADIKMSDYDIAQGYMIFGGIPFYWNYLQRGLSLAQNVDRLFFSPNAPLRIEYDRLFASVFKNSVRIKKIVECLGTKNIGYTRQQLSELIETSSGGTLSDDLEALLASDFIVKYCPFGRGKREERYKLTDPFCLFYLKFIQDKTAPDPHFWQLSLATPSIVAWRGFAFENICFNHVEQIKKALGISGVITVWSMWYKKAEENERGAQLDLIIVRKDNVVNVCEIKFCGGEFTVSKDYHGRLLERQEIVAQELTRRQVIQNTLITTSGLTYNEHSGFFDNVITLEQLFA